MLLLIQCRTDAVVCNTEDKNSLLMLVTVAVPWQQRHISMETQTHVFLWFSRRLLLVLGAEEKGLRNVLSCHMLLLLHLVWHNDGLVVPQGDAHQRLNNKTLVTVTHLVRYQQMAFSQVWLSREFFHSLILLQNDLSYLSCGVF